jgi:hypothetical protein
MIKRSEITASGDNRITALFGIYRGSVPRQGTGEEGDMTSWGDPNYLSLHFGKGSECAICSGNHETVIHHWYAQISEDDIRELIEKSSLGTPGAKKLRERAKKK